MKSETETPKKAPYEAPTLEMRERLAEVAEGMLPTGTTAAA